MLQDDQTGLAGRHVLIYRGYKSVVDCLAAPPIAAAAAGAAAALPPGPPAAAAGAAAAATRAVLLPPRVHLNSPVKRISVTEGGVVLKLLTGAMTQPFDFCLVTLPLGLLLLLLLMPLLLLLLLLLLLMLILIHSVWT